MPKKKSLPPPDGTCWCGCGGTTDAYFSQGHDKRAEAMLLKLEYGPSESVASFLVAHGYGPGGKNLAKRFEAIEKEVSKNALALWAKAQSRK